MTDQKNILDNLSHLGTFNSVLIAEPKLAFEPEPDAAVASCEVTADTAAASASKLGGRGKSSACAKTAGSRGAGVPETNTFNNQDQDQEDIVCQYPIPILLTIQFVLLEFEKKHRRWCELQFHQRQISYLRIGHLEFTFRWCLVFPQTRGSLDAS